MSIWKPFMIIKIGILRFFKSRVIFNNYIPFNVHAINNFYKKKITPVALVKRPRNTKYDKYECDFERFLFLFKKHSEQFSTSYDTDVIVLLKLAIIKSLNLYLLYF